MNAGIKPQRIPLLSCASLLSVSRCEQGWRTKDQAKVIRCVREELSSIRGGNLTQTLVNRTRDLIHCSASFALIHFQNSVFTNIVCFMKTTNGLFRFRTFHLEKCRAFSLSPKIHRCPTDCRTRTALYVEAGEAVDAVDEVCCLICFVRHPCSHLETERRGRQGQENRHPLRLDACLRAHETRRSGH